MKRNVGIWSYGARENAYTPPPDSVPTGAGSDRLLRGLRRVGAEIGDIGPLQGLGVGCLEYYPRSDTGFEGVDPPARAKTPAVSGV